jgi:glycosyltransferase involved in cell wall biosynthesis
MNPYFPKVLILGTPINQTSGSSITVSNLFHGWPKEKLAVVHSALQGNDPGRASEFKLRMDMALPWMKRGIQWKTREEIISAPNSLSGETKTISSHDKVHRDVIRKVVKYLGVAAIIRQFPMTPDLIDFVAHFKPDVFYSQLGDIPVAALLQHLTTRFDVPYVVHIMDDYPATLYRKGLFAKQVRRKMHSQLMEVFSRAGACMGICQAMCEEYNLRYGRDFTPFHNTVDLSVWNGRSVQIYQDKKSYRLAYSGRIGVSCLSSIQEICDVIEGWNNPAISVAFDIYVNNIDQALRTAPFLNRAHSNIQIKQAPKSTTGVAALLSAADILVLPVDFDQDSIEYIRFSMPTKVPAYMATGVPVLVYGPSDIASVKYAKTHGWGHVIEERSPEALTRGILRLCVDSDLRNQLSQQSRQLAALNHETATVRERFRETIVRAARSKNALSSRESLGKM